MRSGLLALIAVAILGAQPALAYQAAASGVEIVLSSLGGNLYEMTLESDRALTDGVFDLSGLEGDPSDAPATPGGGSQANAPSGSAGAGLWQWLKDSSTRNTWSAITRKLSWYLSMMYSATPYARYRLLPQRISTLGFRLDRQQRRIRAASREA